MEIKKIDVNKSGHEMICDEYLITGFKSIEDINYAIDKLLHKYPGHLALVTLDDLGQAQYTSMHAVMSEDLDDINGHDLSSLDSSCFENGEHIGCLSTKSEFFIRERNFLSKTKSVNFNNVCKSDLSIEEEELALLENIHNDPINYLDSNIIIKIAPVNSPSMMLCTFPNGYFSSDLNPFENYALAQHLAVNFNYQLFGIGASLIAFKKLYGLEQENYQKLGKEIAAIFGEEGNESVIQRFTNLCQNNDILFLKYVESI